MLTITEKQTREEIMEMKETCDTLDEMCVCERERGLCVSMSVEQVTLIEADVIS